MANSIDAYLGIGANLGDRVQSIIDARNRLSALPYCRNFLSSSLYWSSPVGFDAQPAFINCAVRLKISIDSAALLADMQAIEASLGRERCADNQNAPRTIDLDILLFGDEKINSNELLVPHPRMLERRFVIEPLLELSHDLSIEGARLGDLYAELEKQGRYDGQELYRLGK